MVNRPSLALRMARADRDCDIAVVVRDLSNRRRIQRIVCPTRIFRTNELAATTKEPTVPRPAFLGHK